MCEIILKHKKWFISSSICTSLLPAKEGTPINVSKNDKKNIKKECHINLFLSFFLKEEEEES